MGWRPKEEFHGDANRWTDAKSFIERGEAELPIIRERYRALDDRFARMENEFGSTRSALQAVTVRAEETQSVLTEFRDRAKRAEEIAYARARGDLEGRMQAAVDQADQTGYARAKSELDNLNRLEREHSAAATTAVTKKDSANNTTQAAQQVPDPVVEQWVTENPWFKVDQGMAGYATAKFQELRGARPGVSVRDHLDEVRADIVARFPDKFENPRRNAAAAVASPTAGHTTPKRKGPLPFDQWPADAKAGFNKFKKAMPDYKPEEYAAIYFAGDDS
jgi:hypothetical protein